VDVLVLVASIILWLVAVYAGRTAVFGNPLQVLVRQAAPELAARMDALTTQETPVEISPDELRFLRRFSRLGLLEMIMLGTELVVFGVLWWVDVMPVLSLSLFLKNIVMLAFSIVLAYTYMANGIFKALMTLPRWISAIERTNALASAAGALVILLRVNGLLNFSG
jgi:hypothetical protein